jgi:hypothetical protein
VIVAAGMQGERASVVFAAPAVLQQQAAEAGARRHCVCVLERRPYNSSYE